MNKMQSMNEHIQYIATRATSTKNWHYYICKSGPRYNRIIDLSAATLGNSLAMGIFLLSSMTIKSGPLVLLSLFISASLASAFGILFTELRSRFARVQDIPYQYLMFGGGELAGVFIGCLELAKNIACSSSVAKALSTYIDFQTGMKIQNLTLSVMSKEQTSENSYLDILGFVMALLFCIFVTICWNKRFVTTEMTNWAYSGAILVVLVLFVAIALPHISISHWNKGALHVHEITGNAAILLIIFDNSKDMFTMTDFRRLGIKRTVLRAYVLTTIASVTLIAAFIAVLLSLSSFKTLKTDIVSEVYDNSGITWAKYLFGVIALTLFSVQGVHYLLKATQILSDMAMDLLIPKVFQPSVISQLPSFLGLSLIGVATCFSALSGSIIFLINVAALCITLQNCLILSIAVSLRYKPSYHMFNIQATQTREESALIRQQNNNGTNVMSLEQDSIGDYLYGAFSQEQSETSTDMGGREDEDIDEVVEQFRLQKAAQSYRNSIGKTVEGQKVPSRKTYSSVNISLAIYTVATMAISLLVLHYWKSLTLGHSLPIISLVLLCIASVACIFMLHFQPRDKIIPKTLLIKAPQFCLFPMIVLSFLVCLCVSVEPTTWILIASTLTFGLLTYVVNVVVNKTLAKHKYGDLSIQSQTITNTNDQNTEELDSFTFSLSTSNIVSSEDTSVEDIGEASSHADVQCLIPDQTV